VKRKCGTKLSCDCGACPRCLRNARQRLRYATGEGRPPGGPQKCWCGMCRRCKCRENARRRRARQGRISKQRLEWNRGEVALNAPLSRCPVWRRLRLNDTDEMRPEWKEWLDLMRIRALGGPGPPPAPAINQSRSRTKASPPYDAKGASGFPVEGIGHVSRSETFWNGFPLQGKV
jgi:hypothetical protein